MVITYHYRLKNPKRLAEKARAVNYVWNYCGDVQNQTRRRRRRWLSGFDLCKLVAGSGTELQLGSDVFQAVCMQFAKSRDKIKHRPRWRKSSESKRSLGWIPFQAGRAIKVGPGFVTFMKVRYPVWMDRPVAGRILCGSFSEDSRGRWYINLQCEVAEVTAPVGAEEIGIDLGLKDFAALSTGEKIENPRHYQREEVALAKAQRAGRKTRAQALHAKIKNRRKHDLHVASVRLIRRSKTVFVGNVNAAGLAKTRFAKSVLDAGWSIFRDMLRYKAIRHGVRFAVVDEKYSTQTCSVCKARSGPKGLKGLGVREWKCSCGVNHDRDVNAARNILFSGQSVGPQQTGSLS